MRCLLILCLAVGFPAFALGADGFTYVAVDFYHSAPGDFLGNAEWAWASGRFSGFGFYEAGEENSQYRWFLDQTVSFEPSKWVSLEAEFGAFHEETFLQSGIGFPIGRLPGVRRGFVFLKTIRYLDTAGAGADQTKIVWLSKPLKLGKLNIWTEGFYRFRDNIPDIGQPQFMVSHDKLPQLSFGTEIEIFDGDFNPRLGLKWSWSR